MTELPYAERFFATSERLSNLIGGVRALASEIKLPLDPALAAADQTGELQRPLRVIACGEVNSGKSSFLNGLTGHDVCPVSPLPLTDRILHYRFGDPAQAAAAGDCCLKFGFLKRIELIDTPGTDRGAVDHLDMLADHAGSAEMVFLVFAAANPWCAATWDLLDRLPATALERVALVIQQIDSRAAADVEVIVGHMEDLARKRIGRVPPVFPVSARLASAAWRDGSRAGWQASGYAKLADFITRLVSQCPQRRALLEQWRADTAAALNQVDDHLERRHRSLINHNRFLDGIEGEIEHMREQFVGRLPRHLLDVAETFENEVAGVARLLHRRLRALPSLLRLFTGTRAGAEIERDFVARLQQSISAVAGRDGTEVAEACADHWQQLGPRVLHEMDVEIDALPAIEQTLALARERFVNSLGEAASQGIGNLRVRHYLDRDLRKRDIALRSFLISGLLFTTGGAVCGALHLPWLPWVLCGLAAVFFAGGLLVAWVTRRRITHEFRQRMLDVCGAFANALRGDYEEALGAMFREYADCLAPLRTHLAQEKLASEPRQHRWQQLFLTLKEIEQDW